MGSRQIRDTMSKGKQVARYGVFLNVRRKASDKHVTLHSLPCRAYEEKVNGASAAGTYTMHKDHRDFVAAMKNASEWSLNWYAGLRACSKCWKK